jgi:hypothetical protein
MNIFKMTTSKNQLNKTCIYHEINKILEIGQNEEMQYFDDLFCSALAPSQIYSEMITYLCWDFHMGESVVSFCPRSIFANTVVSGT